MTALSLPLPLSTTVKRTAFRKVVLNEARLTWRRPVGLVVGVALPVILTVIFGQLPIFHQASARYGGLTPFDAYVPVLAAFSLAMLALLGLPIPLASYRELGLLRRLSTTPVPPSWLLAAQALVQFCVAVTSLTIIMVISVVAYGAPDPKSPAGLLVAVVLSIAGLFPIGLMIASVSRTAGGASVIGRLAFFPLMFFAGLWLPRAEMSPVLLDISNYSPLGPAVQAIQDSMFNGFPSAQPLLVLAGYAVVCGFLARRFFRWD
jgi:ABC-2 type transport system permease protein